MLKFPPPAMCVALASMIVALGGAGYSATGGNFILGASNSAATQTRLVASLNGPAFRVDNLNSGANASGLKIITNAARPPLVVNSVVKVANLNADLLDGIDATGFMRGFVDGQAIALAPNTIDFLGPAVGGQLRLRYACPLGLGGNGTLRIVNASTGLVNLFIDSGGTNPDYFALGAGGFVEYPAAAGGDSFSIQAQSDQGVATAEVATVHRSGSNDCHAQALFVMAS